MMAYYYALDSDNYFVQWSVGAAFTGGSKLPDSVVVPEPLQNCTCNVQAYKYEGGAITYNPDRAETEDLYVPTGAAGKDGVSCTHSWNGTVLTVTSASGTSSADLKGATGAKGDKGDPGSAGAKGDKGDPGATGAKGDKGDPGAAGAKGDKGDPGAAGAKGDKGDPGAAGAKGDTGATGAAGKDGVPCTHSWNGTVLTITSASGTSSADLKGEKGDPGGGSGADVEALTADEIRAICS